MPKKEEEFIEEDILEEGAEDEFEDEPAEKQEDKAVEEEMESAEDLVESEAVKMTADVPVQVVAVLGKKTISVKELVTLKMGQVIDLARPVNEMVDLIAGGKLIAKGEIVDIDGKMGVRIVKMMR